VGSIFRPMRFSAVLLLSLSACAAASSDPDSAPAPLAPSTYEAAVLKSSWKLLPNAPSLPQGKQDDAYFMTPDHGFLVSGPRSQVYETTDGGNTWRSAFARPDTYLRSVLFLNEMHGFVGALGPRALPVPEDNVPLFETNDGGQTFTPVTAIDGPKPAGICNQTKIDDQNLIAVGRVAGPAHFLKSSDSGKSWKSTDLTSQLASLIDAHFASPSEGIVVGGTAAQPMRCTVLRTTDGGATFSTVFTSATPNLCWKIDFPSAKVGYVSIQNASGATTFVKTTDGGATWTEKALIGDPYPAIGIGFATETVGWVSSANPTQPVLRTVDGGETWQVEPSLSGLLNRFRFVDKKTAYAIGGKVFKLDVDWAAAK